MSDTLERLRDVVQQGIGDVPPVEEIERRHRSRRQRRRRVPVVSLLVATGVAAAAISVAHSGHESTGHHNGFPTEASPHPPPLRVGAVIHVGFVSDVAFGFGSVWAPGHNDLRRIDPGTNRVAATIPVPGASDYRYVATGTGAVWMVDSGTDALTKVDPRTDRIVASLRLPGEPTGLVVAFGRVWVMLAPPNGQGGIAVVGANDRLERVIDLPETQAVTAGGGFVWLSTGMSPPNGPQLMKIDPSNDSAHGVDDYFPMVGQILALTYAHGLLWASGRDGVVRIDLRTRNSTWTGLGAASSLGSGNGSVWAVFDENNINGGHPGQVQRIDPEKGRPEGSSVVVGETPVGIAIGDHAAWVASFTPGTITRIDIG